VKESAEKVVKDIRRATRRHFSAEDKIRIVLEGLRRAQQSAEENRSFGRFRRRFCDNPVSWRNLYRRDSADSLR
jgi:transposase-like protein